MKIVDRARSSNVVSSTLNVVFEAEKEEAQELSTALKVLEKWFKAARKEVAGQVPDGDMNKKEIRLIGKEVTVTFTSGMLG